MNTNLKKGSSSLSFSSLFASIILFGPLTAGTVALFGAVNWQTLREIKSTHYLKWVFNGLQLSIGGMISGLVYVRLGGLLLSETTTGFTLHNFDNSLVPLLLALITYYFLNTFMVNIVISINEGISVKDLWRMSFSWIDLNYLSLGFMGIIFAQIFHLQPFALILLVVPLAVARLTFSRYMKLEQAYTETIGALIKAIEAKDEYTRGHSDRVAEISVKVARKLNLSEDDVENLGRVAALHDIGKIGIPKSILTKPGKLTDDEFLKIKEHPSIGAKILKDVPFLKDLIPAVIYHHEKFDGSGYGAGLSGSNIPLFARIVAIADSYDAMTSNRAYRKALDIEVVVDQLLNNSGSQFDSKIVAALIEVLGVELNEEQKAHLYDNSPNNVPLAAT